MPKHPMETAILFVANNDDWKGIYEREAERVEAADTTVFDAAADAIAHLEGLEEVASAVFTDSLKGGWRDIVAAAKVARTHSAIFVISGDPRMEADIETAGATFIYRGDVNPGFAQEALGRIL